MLYYPHSTTVPHAHMIHLLLFIEQACIVTCSHAYSSRLMVVSHEAKKEQSELPKTKCVTVFYTSESFRNITS